MFRKGLLLSAWLLSGCVAHTPLDAPTIATIPDKWSASNAASRTSWPDASWWRGFRSAELDQLVETAIANNQDLAAAAARVLRFDASARISGSALLPSIAIDAAGSERGAARTPTSQSFSAFALGSYELDLWGRLWAQWTAGRKNALAASYDRDMVAITITAEVVRLYFGILSARERTTIARSNLATARRILSTIEARVRNGASGDLDLAQQRAAIAGQEAMLPPFDRQEFELRAALAELLDLPMPALRLRASSLAGIRLAPVRAGTPSELLLRRPDIQRAEAQLEAAAANVEAARAAFLPRISLTASGGFQSAALGSLLSGGSLLYAVAGNLAQQVFDGGRLIAQYEVSQASRAELVASYRQTIAKAFTETNVALKANESFAAQSRSLGEQLGQARIAFQLSTTRYESGATDLITVLDAQRTLFLAQDQLSQTHLQRLNAHVALFRALGGGWHRPHQHVDTAVTKFPQGCEHPSPQCAPN